MKKIVNVIIVFLFLTGCGKIVAPEIVRQADRVNKFWVSDRENSEILAIDGETGNILRRQSFPSPVNDLRLDSHGRLWAVCDGVNGLLLELNPANLNILSKTPLGHTPSAIAYNEKTGTLWITQRFNNELLEVDPVSKEIVSRISVGREPVDIVSVRGGNYMLVVNNLPAMPSIDEHIAARIDVVDAINKNVVKEILLINGSTDVRAITVCPDGRYAYVTHILARFQLPTNMVDRGWMNTNAMSIINLETLSLETAVLLDTPQRGAANPSAIEVSPDGNYIVIALTGTHELCVINRQALHDRLAAAKRGERVVPSLENWDNIPNDAGFLHGIRDFIPVGGRGTRGFAFAQNGSIIASNYFSGSLSKIDIQGNTAKTFTIGTPLTSTLRGLGEMHFHDATLCFQKWQSCASCHPNNARMDGLNWDLLNDGAGNAKNTKSLLFAHETPPSMVTGIRPNAETAVRAGFRFIHFAYLPDEVAQAVDVYLRSLRPVPSPYLVDGELSAAARRGKIIFNQSCYSCHSGVHHTNMNQYYVDWYTGRVKIPLDVPTLREVWRTAPYLYDGRAFTIREMLDMRGFDSQFTSAELDDLAEFVLSL